MGIAKEKDVSFVIQWLKARCLCIKKWFYF
jgi:hypothetical protein